MARGRAGLLPVGPQRLHLQIDELWERMGGLPSPVEAADIWRGIWFEEAHHSTAIEGNTLVLKQVEKLLAEGRAVGDRELREYVEVRGYADASEWVYGQAIEPDRTSTDPLTMHEIRHIHRQAMTAAWDVAPHPNAGPDEGPGDFRQHDIQPFTGGMVPPTYVLVDAEMRSWIDAVHRLDVTDLAFAEDVARLHCRFEQILYKQQRSAYLAALRRADTGDAGALGELIARAILDNLYKFVVPAVAGPARLVPLAALATDDVKAGALRAAAVRGVLQATKGPDGQWRSSKNWVNEYLKSRHKRRTA